MVFGIVPTARGIYYVACDQRADPVALRYFEFSTRRSFDLGPPPLGGQPILTVSSDGRRPLQLARPFDVEPVRPARLSNCRAAIF
jgi:hypothetical protein